MKKEIVVMRYLLDEIETFYNENKNMVHTYMSI